MVTHEPAASGEAESTARLNAKFAGMDTGALLHAVIKDLFPGRIAIVSSFGADSAVLLHMVAEIDSTTPVLFIDTKLLLPETLVYRDEVVARLGLSNVITIEPEPSLVAEEDPENFLWSSNPDRCCEIRKVLPLAQALRAYDAWISGRKRFQAHTRSNLALFEAEGPRTKINPLADWTAAQIASYLKGHGLRPHPLVAKGYTSIGCIPCTSPVEPGEDARAGRWRGRGKIECGLHTSQLDFAVNN
jgi:phosphoadenosine phosphosulfate reductase